MSEERELTECVYIHWSKAQEYHDDGWDVTRLPPHDPFCLATKVAEGD